MEKAVRIANGEPPEKSPVVYYNPAVALARQVFRSWKEGFAVDVETPSLSNHRIMSIAVSGGDEAIVWGLEIPGVKQTLGPLKEALKDQRRKVFQNADFDLTVLRKCGYEIPNETVWDTMFENQLLHPDEPVNLSFLTSLVVDREAWKHLREVGGEDLLFYNSLDANNTWRVYKAAQKAYEEFEQ